MIIFALLALAVVVSPRPAYAAPQLESIYGMNLARRDHDELNPLHGLVWTEGGIAENYGELLEPRHPLRLISVALFHRTGAYEPSTLAWGRALTPFVIGQWLGTLAMHADPHPEGEKNVVVDTLFQRLNLSDEPSFKRLNANQKKYQVGVAKRLAERAWEARNDSRTYRIFLTLLWQKSTSKHDILNYYRGLHAEFGDTWASYLDAEAASLFDTKIEPSSWLAKQFHPVADAHHPAGPPPSLDRMLYAELVQRQLAPPIERTADVPLLGGLTTPGGIEFPDCGETSLRNFFKLLCDRRGVVDEGHDYDARILRAIGASQEVITFFEESFSTRESQTTPEARAAWAAIASNLPNSAINYSRISPDGFRHALTPGAGNMLTLIGTLLPHAPLPIRDWAQLERFIDAERTKIVGGSTTFTLNAKPVATGFGTIHFQIGSWRLGWSFQPEHFHVFDRNSSVGRGSIGIDRVALTAALNGPHPFARARSADAAAIDRHALAIKQERVDSPPRQNTEWLGLYIPLRTDADILEHIESKTYNLSVWHHVGLLNRLTLDASRIRAVRELGYVRMLDVVKTGKLEPHDGYPKVDCVDPPRDDDST